MPTQGPPRRDLTGPPLPPTWGLYAACARNQDYASAVELVGSCRPLRRHFAAHLSWSTDDRDAHVVLDWYAAARDADGRSWTPGERHLLDLVLFLVRPELEHDVARPVSPARTTSDAPDR